MHFRHLFILLLLDIILCESCGPSCTWRLDNDTLVIEGTGKMDDYDAGEDDVSSAPWSDSCEQIKHIVVKNGITAIGAFAFAGLFKLESSVFADTVVDLGHDAFKGCSATSIVLGNKLEVIGDRAFIYCGRLQYLSLPASVKSIGDKVFYSCSTLKSGKLGGIDWVINGTRSEMVMTGYGPMMNFTTTSQPWDCQALNVHSITIGEGITSIGDYAFHMFVAASPITLPDSLISIGKGSFSLCNGLTSLNIPSHVEYIGEDAFQACKNLADVHIPESVVFIGDGAFAKDYSLYSIDVNQNNEFYKSVAGVLFTKDMHKLLQYPHEKPEASYIVPKEVSEIARQSFAGASHLASVNITGPVKDIPKEAFDHCPVLTEVILPDTVITIGIRAFQNCGNLTSITLPGSLTVINDDAFYSCEKLNVINYDGSNDLETCSSSAFRETTIKKVYVSGDYTAQKFCNIFVDHHGTFQTDVVWEFSEEKTLLQLTGVGHIYGALSAGVPWDKMLDRIAQVYINVGIDEITSETFGGYPVIDALKIARNPTLAFDIAVLPKTIKTLIVDNTLAYGSHSSATSIGCQNSCVSARVCSANSACKCEWMTVQYCPLSHCDTVSGQCKDINVEDSSSYNNESSVSSDNSSSFGSSESSSLYDESSNSSSNENSESSNSLDDNSEHTKDQGPNMKLIIGIIIGVGSILVIAILAGLVIYWKTKRTTKYRPLDVDETTPINSSDIQN